MGGTWCVVHVARAGRGVRGVHSPRIGTTGRIQGTGPRGGGVLDCGALTRLLQLLLLPLPLLLRAGQPCCVALIDPTCRPLGTGMPTAMLAAMFAAMPTAMSTSTDTGAGTAPLHLGGRSGGRPLHRGTARWHSRHAGYPRHALAVVGFGGALRSALLHILCGATTRG